MFRTQSFSRARTPEPSATRISPLVPRHTPAGAVNLACLAGTSHRYPPPLGKAGDGAHLPVGDLPDDMVCEVGKDDPPPPHRQDSYRLTDAGLEERPIAPVHSPASGHRGQGAVSEEPDPVVQDIGHQNGSALAHADPARPHETGLESGPVLPALNAVARQRAHTVTSAQALFAG